MARMRLMYSGGSAPLAAAEGPTRLLLWMVLRTRSPARRSVLLIGLTMAATACTATAHPVKVGVQSGLVIAVQAFFLQSMLKWLLQMAVQVRLGSAKEHPATPPALSSRIASAPHGYKLEVDCRQTAACRMALTVPHRTDVFRALHAEAALNGQHGASGAPQRQDAAPEEGPAGMSEAHASAKLVDWKDSN